MTEKVIAGSWSVRWSQCPSFNATGWFGLIPVVIVIQGLSNKASSVVKLIYYKQCHIRTHLECCHSSEEMATLLLSEELAWQCDSEVLEHAFKVQLEKVLSGSLAIRGKTAISRAMF